MSESRQRPVIDVGNLSGDKAEKLIAEVRRRYNMGPHIDTAVRSMSQNLISVIVAEYGVDSLDVLAEECRKRLEKERYEAYLDIGPPHDA